MAATGTIYTALAVVFAVTTVSIFALKPIAVRTGWVDRPNARKRHDGDVPLVGGIAIFLGISAGVLCLASRLNQFQLALFASTAVIALIGAIDDRFDISARLRMLVQIVLVLIMVQFTGVHVHTLGTYFGHDFALGWMGIPFTVIAVAGLLNAFNMMDGLDGLCGAMCLISIAAITLLHGVNLSTIALILACMAGVALLPYLAFNLSVCGKHRKIFMGDAGSMALGFIIAWSLIDASQRADATIMPATVLWLVAVPMMDALTVMLSRILRGKSPLSPGRNHIHHILQRAGLGPRKTLLVLAVTAVILAGVGRLLEQAGATASLMLFILMVAVYAIVRIVALKALDDDVAIHIDTGRGHQDSFLLMKRDSSHNLKGK